MGKLEQIKAFFIGNGGSIRTSQLLSFGIHNTWLTKLMNQGKISKVKRGLYEWVEDGGQPEAAIISTLYPDAVICLASALFYYGYVNRTPDAWHLTFNRDINKKRLHIQYPPVKPYYIEPHFLPIGVTTVFIDGHELQIYDKERTICDVLRYARKIDRELFNEAIKSYLDDSEKNVARLIAYSKQLRVFGKVEKWIGVWL
jgi:hypothetical protein